MRNVREGNAGITLHHVSVEPLDLKDLECMKCNDCQIEMEVLDIQLHLATFRCPKCGGQNMATVSMKIEPDYRWFRVLIAWKSEKPTPIELSKLREIMPALRRKTAQEFVKSAKHVKAWDCGEMAYGDAVDLREAATAQGLRVYLIDVSRHEH